MRIGRPLPELAITHDERDALLISARRPKPVQALDLRAKTTLSCAEGKTSTEMASRFQVTQQMTLSEENSFPHDVIALEPQLSDWEIQQQQQQQ